MFRDDAAAEADRRDVQPELHHERDDDAEVAVFDVQCGDPQSRPHRGGKGHRNEQRQRQYAQVGSEAVPEHQPDQNESGDQEVHEADDHRAGRDDQPREVHLGDHAGIADQALTRAAEGIGEELPGQQGGEHQDRIGGTPGGQFGQLAEYQREHQHGQQGPAQRPQDADDGLFVAHQDVAPGEEQEQLAIAPQVAPVVALGAAGFDDQGGGHGGGLLA